MIEPNQNDGRTDKQKREESRRACDRASDIEWSDAEDPVVLPRHRGAVARVKMHPREVKERKRDRRSQRERRRTERHTTRKGVKGDAIVTLLRDWDILQT
jgi:hypothetical protein